MQGGHSQLQVNPITGGNSGSAGPVSSTVQESLVPGKKGDSGKQTLTQNPSSSASSLSKTKTCGGDFRANMTLGSGAGNSNTSSSNTNRFNSENRPTVFTVRKDSQTAPALQDLGFTGGF